MKNINYKMRANRIFIGIVAVTVFIPVFVLVIIFLSNKNIKSDINNKIKLEAIISDQENQIDLSIYNNDKEMITCGLEFEIQIYKGNKWKKCTDEVAVDLIGIVIFPDKSYVQNIILDHIHIDKGETYRIKKVIDGNEYYSNEFIIK